MGIGDRGIALHHLNTLFSVGMIGGLTDAQLLERFTSQRDETAELAFRVLVERHGPMVLRVCRAVLRDAHDADDAFQATFLVLLRRAGSLWVGDSLGPWLHQVAYRTASCARSAASRRRQHELRAAEMTARPRNGGERDELGAVLHEELARLPERYREAVVHCLLEGLTPQQAARHLNCPVGTVHSRLARGRRTLAKRLARRGFAGAIIAAALADDAASACMSCELVVATARAARLSVSEGAAAKALLSARAITLTQGVLQFMVFTKIKIAVAVLLVFGIAVLGAGGLISRTPATEQAATMPDVQENGQANPDDLRERVLELKQQLQQMQKKIANLEQQTQTGRNERNTCDTTFLANRFKYRVPFETGRTQSREGSRIEIREVWGTRPRIEIGGQYLVRGKYVLPPGQRGMLYFYATAGGAWGQTASLDLQSAALEKQEGEFALVHGMAGAGHFHLILTAAESYSRWFADVYFGTGDNVWRDKP
jgi:RNA polymerase sigma factor (sigma-70 family)